MVRLPRVVNLSLCHHVVVEEGTKNLTLVNCFRRLIVPDLALPAPTFFAVAVLTDGRGAGTMELNITRLEDEETVHSRIWEVTFDDPLASFYYTIRVRDCQFFAAGAYQANLLADGDSVGHVRFRVHGET